MRCSSTPDYEHTTEEVVAGGDIGNDYGVLTMCDDEAIDGPAGGVGVLKYLGPNRAATVGGCGSEIHSDGSLRKCQ